MKGMIRSGPFALTIAALALGSPVAANDDHEKDIVDTAVDAGSFTS